MTKPRVVWLGAVAALLLSGPAVRGDLIWLDHWQVTARGHSSWNHSLDPEFEMVNLDANAFAQVENWGEPGERYVQYDGLIEIYRPFVVRNAPAGGEVVSLEFYGSFAAARSPVGMSSGIRFSVDLAGIKSREQAYEPYGYGDNEWFKVDEFTVFFEEGQQGYIRASLFAGASASPYAGSIATAWANGTLDLFIRPLGIPVPEPSGFLLFSLGLGGLALARTRRGRLA